jgi:hypothetical protein
MRNVGTHRTLGRVLLGQFMRNIRYAMIVPSTTTVKVIAVQIVGLLVALGAAVEEPDRETFWEVTSADISMYRSCDLSSVILLPLPSF